MAIGQIGHPHWHAHSIGQATGPVTSHRKVLNTFLGLLSRWSEAGLLYWWSETYLRYIYRVRVLGRKPGPLGGLSFAFSSRSDAVSIMRGIQQLPTQAKRNDRVKVRVKIYSELFNLQGSLA